MPLFQLPPEVIIQIFDLVGSSYFQSDLSRLRVCKQWSEFARTACFRDFHLTRQQLPRLITAPESSRQLVSNNIERLYLKLKPLEDWDSPNLWNQTVEELQVLAVWADELNLLLVDLANKIIKEARKLRNLRIQATTGLQVPPPESCGYLYLDTLNTLLVSASNLTSLDLDLIGTRLESDLYKGFQHVCPTIAALLPTLQCLRLRLRTICADVLKLAQDHSNSRVRLNKLLVNLSLSYESPVITAATHSQCCGSSSPTGGFLQLKEDLEKQAQTLVAYMAAPKMVRILTHVPHPMALRAFDALTGRTIQLGEGEGWGGEGEAIGGEDGSDDESEESEIASLDWEEDGE
ncbi:hypothetical protein QBC43DRAFT_303581 [Cladorrhinum sp. PSN259]|nr:hypothetical protein QBC43DRAFT_303581 [Cladorrhinum sp. PSN259]